MKPECWTAIASVVNAITVVVLAVVTYWYARSANARQSLRISHWGSSPF